MSVGSGSDRDLAGRVIAALFAELGSPERREAVAVDPFDMDHGLLGDAFTATALYDATGDPRWRELTATRLGQLSQLLYTRRVDRMGLVGGLTGFLLLLEHSGTDPVVREGVTAAVTRRIRHLAEIALQRMQSRIGVSGEDYGYSAGVAGVAHYLMGDTSERPLVRQICDQLADLAGRPFPDNFWTPVADLPEDLVKEHPSLTFGGRDLGFGTGLAGVARVLAEAAVTLGDRRYRDAALALVDVAVEDLHAHSGGGISGWQSPPFRGADGRDAGADGGGGAGVPGATPSPGHRWCDGLPGWELAVAGDRCLMQRLYAAARYDTDYLDPRRGNFTGPGLGHGVAGRLCLADLVGLPDDPGWTELLRYALRGYADGIAGDAGPGFLEGIGGAVAVWLGRVSGSYSPVLRLIGGVGE